MAGDVFLLALEEYIVGIEILGHLKQHCNTTFNYGRSCLSYGKGKFLTWKHTLIFYVHDYHLEIHNSYNF